MSLLQMMDIIHHKTKHAIIFICHQDRYKIKIFVKTNAKVNNLLTFKGNAKENRKKILNNVC